MSRLREKCSSVPKRDDISPDKTESVPFASSRPTSTLKKTTKPQTVTIAAVARLTLPENAPERFVSGAEEIADGAKLLPPLSSIPVSMAAIICTP